MTIALFMRCIYSGIIEYIRKVRLRNYYFDKQGAFSIFALLRYIYLIAIMVPAVIVANKCLELKGIILVIVISILTI